MHSKGLGWQVTGKVNGPNMFSRSSHQPISSLSSEFGTRVDLHSIAFRKDFT